MHSLLELYGQEYITLLESYCTQMMLIDSTRMNNFLIEDFAKAHASKHEPYKSYLSANVNICCRYLREARK